MAWGSVLRQLRLDQPWLILVFIGFPVTLIRVDGLVVVILISVLVSKTFRKCHVLVLLLVRWGRRPFLVVGRFQLGYRRVKFLLSFRVVWPPPLVVPISILKFLIPPLRRLILIFRRSIPPFLFSSRGRPVLPIGFRLAGSG